MRRAVALAGLLTASLAASGGVAAGQVPPELFGLPVESIAFTSDGPADAREVANLAAFRIGRPLSADDAGATIQNLFATGDYTNILVAAAPAPSGGVAVTIHLWRAYRVGHIVFVGRSRMSREAMLRAVPVQERGPFDAAALAEGANALQRRLATEGYIHARVDPEVTFDPATFTAEVAFRIDAGTAAVVAQPVWDGEIAPFTEEALTARLRLRVGRPYRENAARSAAERLRKFLLEQGRFRASVDLIAAEPTEDGTAIRPVYRVAVGPVFEIEATGIRVKRVRSEFLSLLDAESFDEDLVQQWIDTARQDLQERGRYRAQVEAKTEGQDPVTLRVRVDEGPRYAVQTIVFEGNTSVSNETLRSLIVTRERGLPVIRNGFLVDDELQRDADAILAYYQTRGWIGAKVERPAVTDNPKPNRLDVTFRIVEGPRTFVASRDVQGADHLTPAEVDSALTIRVGEPFNPSAVRQDALNLTNRYWNTGWREASVRNHWTLSEDKTKVDVVFTVDEGIRTFFGKTIIRGNAVTEMSRVERQVAWKEGDPFSEAMIADTQRNLARTGVFRSIEIRPQPADPDNQEHTVDIELSEARRLSLLYGVGYQYAPGATNPSDPFATAGITYRNLFGRMQSVNFEVQYAPISQRGYAVANFVEPYLFNTDFPLTVAAFASREPIQDVDINRLGTFIESVRQFGFVRVGLRYSYQYIKPTNPEDISKIALEKYPLSAFPVQQSAVVPNLLYDRRDDVLDPHKGYYLSMAGAYAFPFLSANAQYGKVSGQVASFWSMFGGVLAASFRAGAIYGKLQTVPIAEKFFAGGSSSARGFDTNLEGIPATLGPDGNINNAADITVDYNTQATVPSAQTPGAQPCATLYPVQAQQNPLLTQYDCSPGPRIVGGNSFVAMGLEFRLPIAGNFGVSLFYDLAQVWASAGAINFHIGGSSGLSQSVGLGVHYMTPIGPLRLEVGRPVVLQTIPFQITRSVLPDGKTPCDNRPNAPSETSCILSPGPGGTAPSVRQTARVFLSIGYPF
ncbi:MAG TPA: POTRA domain-containing protein [Thermoanaerobaculia bacterium]|nr:POTRA domain-containing protein [Thermoanaerobaculia bacterium]